ncbi:hypothetical protein NDU88_003338 [Pleurodeles waltl]|uniref:Uncharacterized protein n=1 Tax=Pleurodeles waltl TaxID=8319 RepID=A0AAV7T4Z2_PLEWA|nr:hypothetical protein NDU88_003338 [Pleurodeles waltl]
MLRFGARFRVPNPFCLGRVLRLERGRVTVVRRFGARFRMPNPFCLGRVWRVERGRVTVVRSWKYRLHHGRNRERGPDFLTSATNAKASGILVGGFLSPYKVARTTRTRSASLGTRISGFPRE